MATYKVLQDIEAEDKFVGPLTLKQFIYASIAAVLIYVGFFSATKGLWVLSLVFLPFIGLFGFLAWPWGRDQPTEVWMLAKLRYFFVPRKRLWNQEGQAENVIITAPKKEEMRLTKDISPNEAQSRLRALANTLDSRGWAVKNVNVNLFAQPSYGEEQTDRLVTLSELPKEVATLDVTASDDILDAANNPTAQHLQQLMNASSQVRLEQIKQKMMGTIDKAKKKTNEPADYWFMNQPDTSKLNSNLTSFGVKTIDPTASTSQTSAVTPTEEEVSMFKQIQAKRSKEEEAQYGHTAVLQPTGSKRRSVTRGKKGAKLDQQPLASTPDPAIINLADRDDLNVATIARLAKPAKQTGDDEVIINLR